MLLDSMNVQMCCKSPSILDLTGTCSIYTHVEVERKKQYTKAQASNGSWLGPESLDVICGMSVHIQTLVACM